MLVYAFLLFLFICEFVKVCFICVSLLCLGWVMVVVGVVICLVVWFVMICC